MMMRQDCIIYCDGFFDLGTNLENDTNLDSNLDLEPDLYTDLDTNHNTNLDTNLDPGTDLDTNFDPHTNTNLNPHTNSPSFLTPSPLFQVGDLTMKALRGADAASHEDEEGDGSWLLSLLKVGESEFEDRIT